MREILFRAKAINRIKGREYRTSYKNGDWVYGLVTKMYDDRFPNLPATMRNTDGVSNIDVDYKSIGQYTGLTDMNGKKIFEGDIVKYKNTSPCFECLTVTLNKPCKIAYINSQFVMAWKNFYRNFEQVYDDEIEVIGNIHDNPELLEVQK